MSNKTLLCTLLLVIPLALLVDLYSSPEISIETIEKKISYRQKSHRGRGKMVYGIATDKAEYVLFKQGHGHISVDSSANIYRSQYLKIPIKLYTEGYTMGVASIYNIYGLYPWAMFLACLWLVYFSIKNNAYSIYGLVIYCLILAACVMGYFTNQIV